MPQRTKKPVPVSTEAIVAITVKDGTIYYSEYSVHFHYGDVKFMDLKGDLITFPVSDLRTICPIFDNKY